MNELRFTVHGTPIPQGSKKGYVVNGRAVLVEANKNLKTWRQHVTLTARQAATATGWQSLDGPVKLTAEFHLQRPPSAKFRVWPIVKPDLDKLLRALCDGLSDAGVWTDDNRVCIVVTSKTYANTAGVDVSVQAV